MYDTHHFIRNRSNVLNLYRFVTILFIIYLFEIINVINKI